MIFFLPLAGLVIVASYRVTKMQDDRGTEFVIGAVREGRVLRFRTAPLIFLGTVLTHLTGGSAGREGAALQLGGCLSGSLGRVLRLDDKDERIITMCGMAGGFSALFGTPLAAAVFAMEVESIGVRYYAALVPCVLSALIANVISSLFGAASTSFTLAAIPSCPPFRSCRPSAWALYSVRWPACSAGPCTREAPSTKKIENPYLRIVVGGCIVVLLSLLVRSGDYNGAGMSVISAALAGHAVPWDFALKIVFTVLTLGAVFKGGEIVPCFFVGATCGCVVAPSWVWTPVSARRWVSSPCSAA